MHHRNTCIVSYPGEHGSKCRAESHPYIMKVTETSMYIQTILKHIHVSEIGRRRYHRIQSRTVLFRAFDSFGQA